MDIYTLAIYRLNELTAMDSTPCVGMIVNNHLSILSYVRQDMRAIKMNYLRHTGFRFLLLLLWDEMTVKALSKIIALITTSNTLLPRQQSRSLHSNTCKHTPPRGPSTPRRGPHPTHMHVKGGNTFSSAHVWANLPFYKHSIYLKFTGSHSLCCLYAEDWVTLD